MLLHASDAGAPLPIRNGRNVHAADGHRAALGRIQSQQQPEHRAFSRTCPTHQRDLLPLLHSQGEVLQHRLFPIAEGHMGERHIAPRRLHQQRHRDIGQHQHRHLGGGLVAAQNVGKALGQPPLKPRRGQQAHVIDQPGGRHKSQQKPLHAEIGADPVGAERLTLPHRPLRLPPFFESAESPRDSPLWTRCTACPAPP